VVAKVFISHASEDAATADHINEWLTDAGHQTFLDHDLHAGITVGEEWQQRLHERLRWADAVVCVVTSTYIASPWCTAEVAVAQSRGSKLLPIVVESTVVHPLLKSLQYVVAPANMQEARAKLVEAIRRVDIAGTFGWLDVRSPFPGLRPFNTDQHHVFFGREHESAELAAQLRSPMDRAAGALLIVVGPSGCGKSSLVRAGLMPIMAGDEGWLTVPAITPGADPVAALTRELAATARQIGLDWSVADVRVRLADRGLTETADELLVAVPGGRRRRLLVVVDQFEELLTQTASGRRSQFAELLSPALSASVQVVGTLRPEFLDQVLVDPCLAAVPTHVYALRPLRREALKCVIEGPAELAGIAVEDGLTSRLVHDTGTGEALPMLAYALAELADGLERGGKLLRSRYDQLGGVQGTLARQADAALTAAMAAGGRTRDDIIRELLRLVTVDEQGRPTRWRVRRDELPEFTRIELDAFVARRLLITDTEDGHAVIGVAHEAFLSAWLPLAEAIAAAATGLRARRAVEQAAAEWESEGHPATRLWERGQLAGSLNATGARLGLSRHVTAGGSTRLWIHRKTLSVSVMPTQRVELSARAQEFLRASIRRDRRRRRRATTLLSVLLVLALGAAALAITQQRIAEERQRIATARSLLTQAESASAVDPPISVRLAEAAFRTHPSAETRAGLVSLILRNPFATSLEAHTGAAYDVAFSPTGRILATAGGDSKVNLWDFSDPVRPNRLGDPLTGHTGAVKVIAFAPDGRILATAGEDSPINLWDVTAPATIRPLTNQPLAQAGGVEALAFNADGSILASVGHNGSVTLWNITNLTWTQRISGFRIGASEGVPALAFDPDGQVLVAASDAGVSVWGVADPAHPQQLAGNLIEPPDRVSALTFARSGHTLVTGTLGGTVLFWDLTDPARPRQFNEPLEGHTQVVSDIAFSPDGRTLVTASADGTARIWNVTDPAQPEYVRNLSLGANRIVFALAFAPDGQILATAEDGGTVTAWDLTDSALPRKIGSSLDENRGARSMRFAPDGGTLATAGDAGAFLWDVSEPNQPRRLEHAITAFTDGANDIAFRPDGHVLAVAGRDGTAVLVDITARTRPRRLGNPLSGVPSPITNVVFAPDGHTLVTACRDGTILLWDVTDPARPHQVGDSLPGQGGASSVAFAPDGGTMAIAGDAGVSLMTITDPAHPQQLGASFNGHAGRVTDVAFTVGDGHILATASDDRTARLWDITNPAEPQQLGDPLTEHLDTIEELAFSSDGQTLATVSDDSSAILWDVTNPLHVHQLGGPLPVHQGAIHDVTFSPNGHTLAIASGDSAVARWDLKGLNDVRADPLRRACLMTRRGLDRAEWKRYVPDSPYLDSCIF
jgi:WD40 repeat protein